MAAEGSGGGGGGGGGGDRKISPSPRRGGSDAAKFLSGLPSRGNFASSSVSSLGGFRVYVCEHSTDPPEGQVIKTDTTNILIRHLQLNKHKSEGKDGGSRTPGESSKAKRSAARSLDVNNSVKKPNLGSSSGSSAYVSSTDLTEIEIAAIAFS
ncbi:hypothetical protein ACP4OV_013116 [Aristida adscensionis]